MASGICPNSTTTTSTTTSTTTTTTAATSLTSPCLAHYWPIDNKTVLDVITGQFSTSKGSPQFVTDRNGLASGAILLNSSSSAWQLPVDTYFQGDTTITMWVKKITCQTSSLGNLC
jgi:hypothetical protein